MKFSVFTASTPQWTPAEVVRELAAQGWDGVEWRITDQEPASPPGFWAGNLATWPLTGLEDELAAIAETTRGAGLEFSSLGGYVQARQRADVERLLAAAATLGAGRVRVRVPGLGEDTYPALFAAARRDLEWVAQRAAHHGVKALVELHHRTIVASASSAIRLVDGLDPAHVGIIHDIGNLVVEGHEDFLAGFEMLGPYLAHVHVKNAAWRPAGEGPDGSVRWEHGWVPMREGVADIEACFRALAAVGYDGWVVSEDFSTAVPLRERILGNLRYFRELRERTGA